ncbi:MAG: hypothetical protein Tp1111DCM1126091_9 [Prokaryotic dsDNA virus sp.]|nr:MAG: hypothetical protein Tp1111DCM1126091_9 [Prokaryotic dsDNA virus sp.]|tara:strand:- start:10543 stop:10731 length:189 start_codon:yes stop_codon:yes gene_type:complete
MTIAFGILVMVVVSLMIIFVLVVDHNTQRNLENLQIAVDSLREDVQNLKGDEETYDGEQEHI